MDYKVYLEARRDILYCLERRNKWGAAHTSIRNLTRNMPRDKRGSKEVKEAIRALFAEGKLMLKKTTEDEHVSLNPRLAKEIHDEINRILLL